jgi:molecular chaperone GrpE
MNDDINKVQNSNPGMETNNKINDQNDNSEQTTDLISNGELELKDKSFTETIEKLEEELKNAKAKADENWNMFLRAKAEVENVRRRAQLDVEKTNKYSIESFAREMINIIDSLDKGLEVSYTGEASQVEAIIQGMQLTHKLFIDILEKFGVKEMNPIKESFDPSKHEALSMQESSDVEPNKILMVVQKGFSIHERILRPARVIVAKPMPSSIPK